MPKLEDLQDEWINLYDEWIANGKTNGSYQKIEKVDRKIAKIRIEIGKLYIGDKFNAKNVLLRRMREETPFWENLSRSFET